MATKIGNKSDLERFLATLPVAEQRQPDEFTAREVHAALKAKGDTRTFEGVRLWLSRTELYDSRKILIDGKWTSVYRVK